MTGIGIDGASAAPGRVTRPRVKRLWRAFVVTVALCVSPVPCWAQTVYVYVRADGSRLITDHPSIEPGYHLLKRYEIGASGLEAAATAPQPPSRSVRRGAAHYDSLIERTARTYGVESALVKAVVQAESSFNPQAVSHKGAYGLMQLLPATAHRYGVTDIADPAQNVRGGVRYLRDLLRLFDDDTRLALAAYNAGENAVKRYGGIPPYAETQNYVRKVLSLRRRYAQR